MKTNSSTLSLLILLAIHPVVHGRVIYQKVIPHQGTLVCDLTDSPAGNRPASIAKAVPSDAKANIKSTFDYRLLWTPIGASAPEILWEIRIHKSKVDTRSSAFLPLDACILPKRRLLFVFRSSREVSSVFLNLDWKYIARPPDLIPVVSDSLQKPLKIYGGALLECDLTSGDLQLILDGTGGQEIFGYDGKSWQRRGAKQYAEFEKEASGLGKVVLEQRATEFPDLPLERLPRLKAQAQSLGMQALLAEVDERPEGSTYIQSMHRHELFLLKSRTTERISLFKKTTYFNPYGSRCPTGFRVFDILAVGDTIYIVYKEQDVLRWAMVKVSGSGATAKESHQRIVDESLHLTYSSAILSFLPEVDQVQLEIHGTGGKRSFRLRDGNRWEEGLSDISK